MQGNELSWTFPKNLKAFGGLKRRGCYTDTAYLSYNISDIFVYSTIIKMVLKV